jgi:hypothetical protein
MKLLVLIEVEKIISMSLECITRVDGDAKDSVSTIGEKDATVSEAIPVVSDQRCYQLAIIF